ncbi:MAG: pilin [Candidatus Altiarchaeota archaeon]
MKSKNRKFFSTIIFLIIFISILSSVVSEQRNPCSAPYECKSIDECANSGGFCESSAGSCLSPNQCCCRPKGVAPGTSDTSKKSVIEQISEEVKRFGCLIFGILFYLSAGIAALFILFAGIKYITSESESERCEARDRVFFGLIGLIVVIIAIPLVNYFIPVVNSALSLYSKDLKIPEVNCPNLPFGGKPTVSGTKLPTAKATSAMDIISIIERIICGFLSLGIYISSGLAALIMVYAGAKYIASADNPEEREKAKSIGAHAVIGLIIVLIALPLANFFAPYVLDCGKYSARGPVVAKTCKDAGGICKNNQNACECVVNNERVRGQYCIAAKGQYEDCEAPRCCCICPTEGKKGCKNPDEEEGTLLCSDNTIFECKNGEWIKKTTSRVCHNGDVAECKNNNWEIKDCGDKICDEKTFECAEKAKECTKDEECCISYPGFRVKCINNVCDPCTVDDLSCYKCKEEK